MHSPRYSPSPGDQVTRAGVMVDAHRLSLIRSDRSPALIAQLKKRWNRFTRQFDTVGDMIIGVPKEVKDHESRVGVTPAGVRALVDAGHTVLVETRAATLSAFPDDDYQSAGAEIVGSAHTCGALPIWSSRSRSRSRRSIVSSARDCSLFTYLHLAPLPGLLSATRQKGIGIAYETIRDRRHTAAADADVGSRGAHVCPGRRTFLQKEYGGRGALLGGVPGVPPADVCIIGGGIVGTNAAKIALGMGAKVTISTLNLNRLRDLDDIFNGRLYTLASNSYNIDARCDRPI